MMRLIALSAVSKTKKRYPQLTTTLLPWTHSLAEDESGRLGGRLRIDDLPICTLKRSNPANGVARDARHVQSVNFERGFGDEGSSSMLRCFRLQRFARASSSNIT